MADHIVKLHPPQLNGPRSFFTDLDRNDPAYDPALVMLKLKLQLLLKGRIVIAASSLFSGIGYELFSADDGLIQALELGIVAPAIRNEFVDPKDFFERGQHKGWPVQAKDFFVKHATHSIPWDLAENSAWFERTLRSHVEDAQSLLRQKTSMSESMAEDFLQLLDMERSKDQAGYHHLRREHVYSVAHQFGEDVHSYVRNYADLIYRISGSRVVNCESHFPQANLTRLGVSDNDRLVSDESIFWDIYVENVIAYLHSAIRLTPDRLASLSVQDILKIRGTLFDQNFANEYDSLIAAAKDAVDIHDPAGIILKQQEINAAARTLRMEFSGRLLTEAQMKDITVRERSLWEVANVLALIPTSGTGLLIGTLSALKSIPQITSLVSKSLAEALNKRYEWLYNFVNHRMGWSEHEKRAVMNGYIELIQYGLPAKK